MFLPFLPRFLPAIRTPELPSETSRMRVYGLTELRELSCARTTCSNTCFLDKCSVHEKVMSSQVPTIRSINALHTSHMTQQTTHTHTHSHTHARIKQHADESDSTHPPVNLSCRCRWVSTGSWVSPAPTSSSCSRRSSRRRRTRSFCSPPPPPAPPRRPSSSSRRCALRRSGRSSSCSSSAERRGRRRASRSEPC